MSFYPSEQLMNGSNAEAKCTPFLDGFQFQPVQTLPHKELGRDGQGGGKLLQISSKLVRTSVFFHQSSAAQSCQSNLHRQNSNGSVPVPGKRTKSSSGADKISLDFFFFFFRRTTCGAVFKVCVEGGGIWLLNIH